MIRELLAAHRPLSWRRLFAWLVATGLLVGHVIDQTTWLSVTLAYIGFEGVQRIAAIARSTPTTATAGDPP